MTAASGGFAVPLWDGVRGQTRDIGLSCSAWLTYPHSWAWVRSPPPSTTLLTVTCGSPGVTSGLEPPVNPTHLKGYPPLSLTLSETAREVLFLTSGDGLEQKCCGSM